MIAGGQTMENTWLMEAFGRLPPSWAKDPFNDDCAAKCNCGAWLEVVRPGKTQCGNPDCTSGEPKS